MNTHPEVEDYFENLCRLHSDLLHEWNGNSAFARLRTDEHIQQITKKATKNIVVVASINGQRVGDIDDQQIRRGISLIFASRSATSGSSNLSIQTAMNKSEEIMFDFIAKMQYDQDNECGLFFDLEKISWDEIEAPWLDNYYGWMLFVPFRGYLAEYNADKWAGVPATPLPNAIIFVARFRVGAVGSPMIEGDTTYTNGLLGNSEFLILSGGKAIHQMTDSLAERFASKTFAGTTITINGGVYDEEVIEIYKIL